MTEAPDPTPDEDLGGERVERGLEVAFGALARVTSPSFLDRPASTGPETTGRSEERPATRFEVLGEERNSGRTSVIRARDHELDRDVSLEVLSARVEAASEALGGFLAEAQVVAQLQHPGILPVLGLGFLEDGRPFVARRLAEGETLADLVARGSQSRIQLLWFLEQAAHAVAYAHVRGVAHGSLEASCVVQGAHGEVVVAGWDRATRTNGDPAPVERDVAALAAMLSAVTGDGAGDSILAGPPRSAREIARAIGGFLARTESRAREAELTVARESVRAERERARQTLERRRAASARRSRLLTLTMAVAVLLAVAAGGTGLAWKRAEDRAAEVRVEREIASAFREATGHEAAGRWDEARAWMLKASAVAETLGFRLPEAEQALERITARRGDETLVARLDSLYRSWLETGLPARELDERIMAAFRDAGIDLEGGDPVVVAAAIRERRDPVRLTAFIDDRWMSRREGSALKGLEWERLCRIAQAADRDPWRMRLREAFRDRHLSRAVALVEQADGARLPRPTLLRAVWLLQTAGKRELALDLLAEAHQREPLEDLLRYVYGREMLEMDVRRWPEQAAVVAGLTALEPDGARAWAGLRNVLAARGDYAAVMPLDRRVTELEPDNFAAWINLANDYANLGRPEEALAAARRASGMDPDEILPRCTMACALAALGRHDEAVALCREIRDLDPMRGAALLGEMLEHRGDLEGAVAALRDAIERGDGSFATWSTLARAYMKLGRPDEVILACEQAFRALERPPPAPFAGRGGRTWTPLPSQDVAYLHSNLVYFLLLKGRVGEAEREGRIAVRLAPEFGAAHGNLGTALLEQGRLAEAVDSLQRGIALDANMPGAHQTLARAYLGLGRPVEAVREARRATELAPDDAGGWSTLGIACREAGRLDDALEAGFESVRVGPRNPTAWTNLGATHFARGEQRLAEEAAVRSTELAPESPMAWLNLGGIRYRRGDFAGARTAYEHVLRCDPSNRHAPVYLAAALQNLSLFREAEAVYRKVLERKPDAARATDAWHGIAQTLHARGDLRGARDAYETAARLGAGNLLLLRDAAFFLATCPDDEVRDPDAAERLALNAGKFASSPEHRSMVTGLLGIVRYRRGRFEEAVKLLERALAVRSNPHEGFHLALAYARTGRQEAGREAYRRSVGWMDAQGLDARALKRFRAEAEALLGIETEKGK